ILISAFISLTLTPMMCARLLKHVPEDKQGRFYHASGQFFDRVIARYGRMLSWVLERQRLTLLVALATLATIVASQALITAVFSLTHQSVQLGFFPRVQVLHTSGSHKGQIYLPLLNWLLMLATVAVVLAFRQSDKLAAAFGLAVSTTMAITTILFAALARRRWHWPWWAVGLVAGGLFAIDLAFWLANVLKFLDGGWLPLTLGLLMFALMGCWFGGRLLQLMDEKDSNVTYNLLLHGVHTILRE
ncbi:hypothetical protein C3F00_034365, partial [Pseudomonas sp. MWU13-2860]